MTIEKKIENQEFNFTKDNKKTYPSVGDSFKQLLNSVLYHWFSWNNPSHFKKEPLKDEIETKYQDSVKELLISLKKLNDNSNYKIDLQFQDLPRDHIFYKYSRSPMKKLSTEQEDEIIKMIQESFSIYTLKEIVSNNFLLTPKIIEEIEKKPDGRDCLIKNKLIPFFNYFDKFFEYFLTKKVSCQMKNELLPYYYNSFFDVSFNVIMESEKNEDKKLLTDLFYYTFSKVNFEKLNMDEKKDFLTHILNIKTYFKKDVLDDEIWKTILNFIENQKTSQSFQQYSFKEIVFLSEKINEWKIHFDNENLLKNLKEEKLSLSIDGRDIVYNIEKLEKSTHYQLTPENKFYIHKLNEELQTLLKNYSNLKDSSQKLKAEKLFKECLSHIKESIDNILFIHETKDLKSMEVQKEYLSDLKKRV